MKQWKIFSWIAGVFLVAWFLPMADERVTVALIDAFTCEALAGSVRTALEHLHIDAEVGKVTSIREIASRGIMLAPALCVDGDIKIQGSVPAVSRLERLLADSNED